MITLADIEELLCLIARLRTLRAELHELAKPSAGGRRLYAITPEQRVAIHDLLRTIDALFPGVPILRPEETNISFDFDTAHQA